MLSPYLISSFSRYAKLFQNGKIVGLKITDLEDTDDLEALRFNSNGIFDKFVDANQTWFNAIVSKVSKSLKGLPKEGLADEAFAVAVDYLRSFLSDPKKMKYISKISNPDRLQKEFRNQITQGAKSDIINWARDKKTPSLKTKDVKEQLALHLEDMSPETKQQTGAVIEKLQAIEKGLPKKVRPVFRDLIEKIVDDGVVPKANEWIEDKRLNPAQAKQFLEYIRKLWNHYEMDIKDIEYLHKYAGLAVGLMDKSLTWFLSKNASFRKIMAGDSSIGMGQFFKVNGVVWTVYDLVHDGDMIVSVVLRADDYKMTHVNPNEWGMPITEEDVIEHLKTK